MGGEFVIQDPCRHYGVRLIRAMHQAFGWRAVCLVTDIHEMRMNLWQYPELKDPALVAEWYRVGPEGLDPLIEHLRDSHDIRATVPITEDGVVPAARIAEALGLSWAQTTVLDRFRDKEALKAHLREQDPDLRLNVSQVVADPAAAVAVARDQGLARFVLKPNDGYGNQNVVFCEGTDPESTVASRWTVPGPLLLEEFVGGIEYHCDGQVDAGGTVAITDVFEEHRVAVNGKENIQIGAAQVPSDSEVFRQVSDYTRRVVAASGLTRSPFHAEIKVDDRGPCLIECAARLVGAGMADVIELTHRGTIDPFAMAARFYGAADTFDADPCDWRIYDSHSVWHVGRASEEWARITDLSGVAQVEALPEFAFWIHRPEVGERIRPTTDLFALPYLVVLDAADDTQGAALADDVRQAIRWNTRPPTLRDRATAARHLVRRRARQLPKPAEFRWPRFP